jgi:hypothetical protein
MHSREERMGYASDLKDAEWAILAPLLEPKQQGRPRQHSLRDICNAIRYVKALPHPAPPHSTPAADRARGAASGVGIGVEAGSPRGRTPRLVPMATQTSSRSAAVAL